MFAVNDPFSGGTHLPDITLVSPMAVDGAVLGYAVTRAHHSDVGGMRPGLDAGGLARALPGGPRHPAACGSCAPASTCRTCSTSCSPTSARRTCAAATCAPRSPRTGSAEQRLGELVARRGRATVEAVFAEVVAYTERRTRETLRGLPDGSATAPRARSRATA